MSNPNEIAQVVAHKVVDQKQPKKRQLTPKQKIIAFLIDQGEDPNVFKWRTLNSIVSMYYARYPEFIDSMNLPKTGKNLQDDNIISDYDHALDDLSDQSFSSLPIKDKKPEWNSKFPPWSQKQLKQIERLEQLDEIDESLPEIVEVPPLDSTNPFFKPSKEPVVIQNKNEVPKQTSDEDDVHRSILNTLLRINHTLNSIQITMEQNKEQKVKIEICQSK